MVLLLHLLGYVAAAAALLFVTLSLASGLLWLSEVIEEHSRTSKLVGVRATYTIIVLHILLWLTDALPFPRILFSITCHFVYLTNFTSQWPLISLSSYSFMGSCVLVLMDHFIWFTYFSQRTHRARQSVRDFGSADWRPPATSEARMLTFMDIATFFAVCVWLIPLFLFLSLSANDNALPVSLNDPGTPVVIPPSGGTTPHTASYFQRMQSNSPLGISTSTRPTTLFQHIVYPIASLFPRLRRIQRLRERDDTDGLIAPVRQKTPLGSPNLSPRSSPPPTTPSSPWMMSPPSPSSSRQEAQSLGVSVGYGRPTPFLHTPPLRRATTDAVAGRKTLPSPSTTPRRSMLGYADGDSNATQKPILEENGDQTTMRTSSGGRRRLHATAEDTFT